MHGQAAGEAARVRPGRRHAIGLVVILLAAAGFRLWGLGDNSLWVDEGYTAYLTARPAATYYRELQSDTAPPLYYWLLRPVAMVAPRSELALRLPSAVLGVMSVWLVYLLAVELLADRTAGLLAAALLAVNQFHIAHCQEARSYSLYLTLALAGMWSVARLARPGSVESAGGSLRRLGIWLGLVLASSAMLYTHNIGFFFAAGLLAAYPLATWANGRPDRSWYRPAALAALAGLAIGLLYLPWVPVLRTQLSQVLSNYWIEKPTAVRVAAAIGSLMYLWPHVPDGFRGLVLPHQRTAELGGLFSGLVWLAAVVGWRNWAAVSRDRRGPVLAVCLAGSVAGLIVFSLVRRPLFMDKVIIPFVAVAVLGPAALWSSLAQARGTLVRGVLRALPVGLVAFGGFVAVASHGTNVHEQWRQATRWVTEQADPSRDAILVDEAFHLMAVEWYLAETPFGPVDWNSAAPNLLTRGGSGAEPGHEGSSHRTDFDEVLDGLERVVRPGRRLWVIERTYHGLDGRIAEFLDGPAGSGPGTPRRARQVLSREFLKVRVRLFESPGTAGATRPNDS